MGCFKRLIFFNAPYCTVLVLTLLASPIGEAAGQTFTGGGDGFSWNDGNNWDGGVVPGGAGDDNPFVEITNQPDVQLNAPTTLNTASGAEEVFVNLTDSVLSVNASSQLETVFGINTQRSTLNLNADLGVGVVGSSGGLSLNGGELNLNSGVLSGSMSLGSADPAGGGGFPPFLPFPP